MGAIAGLLFVTAVILLIMTIVGAIKKSGKAKKRFLIAIACLVLGVIAIQFTDSGKEGHEKAAADQAKKEKAEQAKEKAKKEAEAKKKAEAKEKKDKAEQEAQDKFANIVTGIQDDSNGIIHGINADWSTNHWSAKVYVTESAWSNSNESQKQSFVVSASNQVKRAILNSGLGKKDDPILVDFYSFENDDQIASEKVFGGFKIKR
ncbi:hypothetical protein [Priestia aryabhattai]|uniref:hypothetical protein n=1 Tax=Priestia aryabhattai TaxID=412384 RepID=UPI001FB4257C|nr:hypothetical protein [Priestia aryabhattai]